MRLLTVSAAERVATLDEMIRGDMVGGGVGVISEQGDIIVMLLSQEIILLGVMWGFGEESRSVSGELMIVGVITVAAADPEMGVGLSLVVGYYRERGETGVRTMSILRG